ncbi:MAG: type VI secretion system baseplate subunit TssK [Gammaproteobacteria bacterium]|nr:type VI secretion system baseplate subunit TssK [Gammaproteobacteria bacterium]MBU1557004.1 type VI secretion system baseplate subunit TssK [Gammaproteobacteria bacterium]MBU2069543.1 type VI secretion system baseplate subunit TssK [Gammaproteobacteria bacterium]MBU2183089.1 type VI secretion system baseplate subunit TssK [Gammaproteobacteria bacterium]MBU2206109.1 type VI secretion system baseplate subunit TssK [Gammaproteobacteria bacterium]
MSDYSRIAWTEGLFLRPQHFQQQERYFEYSRQQQLAMQLPYGFGVRRLSIDHQCLKFGQFGLSQLDAVLSDGTVLQLPEVEALPAPVQIDKSCRDQQIYLCLALDKSRGQNISSAEQNQISRFSFAEHTAADNSLSEDATELLQLAKLRLLFKLESEDRGGFICLPVARIKEVSEQGEVQLVKKFIPPLLDISQDNELKAFVAEALGMLCQRADALADRLGKGQGTANSIADFLMLQVLNRYEPLLHHLKTGVLEHPLALYRLMVSMLGELATFTARQKRPPQFPRYQHDDLTAVFGNLGVIMNQTLSVVLEQTAQALPLEQAKFGILVSPLTDKTLLEYAQFVLAVSADIPADDIRKHLPARLKIGPVEHIRELVNNQLPGIAVTGLPVAPRQVPYHAGYHYFQLDKGSIYWERLANSGGLALHLSGNYPGLKLELWAIKA